MCGPERRKRSIQERKRPELEPSQDRVGITTAVFLPRIRERFLSYLWGISLECDMWVPCNDFPERFKEIEELSSDIESFISGFSFVDCCLYVFVLSLPE